MNNPEGFVCKGKEDKVYLLKKALYGLKQALRAWYSRIDDHLLSLGFKKSLSEATLYAKTTNNNGLLVVSLYVDDLLVTGSNLELVQQFKDQMMKVFEMTDLGEMSYFLGIEILQSDQGIFISQQNYAKQVLKNSTWRIAKLLALHWLKMRSSTKLTTLPRLMKPITEG